MSNNKLKKRLKPPFQSGACSLLSGTAGVPLEGLRGFRSGLRGRGRRLGSARSFATAARFTRTCSAMSNTSSRVTLAFPAAPRLFPGDSEGLATTLPPPRASPLPPPRSALVKGALPAHSPEEPPAISPHCPGATTGAGADSAAADFAVDFFGGGEEWSLGDSERSVPDPRLLLLSPSSTSFSCRLCSASSSLLRVSIHLEGPSGGNFSATLTSQSTLQSSIRSPRENGLRVMV